MADRTEQFDALLNNRADQYNSEIQNNIPSLTAEIGSRSFPVPTELGELGDVNLTSPQNNQTLKFNSSTQKWENGNDIRASWGNITGTIDDQTDLKNKFDASLQMLSDTVGWTGKNLLKPKNASSSIFTVNSDNSITVNGTPSSDATYDIDSAFVVSEPCILTGCPSGGGANSYQLIAKGHLPIELQHLVESQVGLAVVLLLRNLHADPRPDEILQRLGQHDFHAKQSDGRYCLEEEWHKLRRGKKHRR